MVPAGSVGLHTWSQVEGDSMESLFYIEIIGKIRKTEEPIPFSDRPGRIP